MNPRHTFSVGTLVLAGCAAAGSSPPSNPAAGLPHTKAAPSAALRLELAASATLTDLYIAIGEAMDLRSDGRCVFVELMETGLSAVPAHVSFSLGTSRFDGWRNVVLKAGTDEVRGAATCNEGDLASFEAAMYPHRAVEFADCGLFRVVTLAARSQAKDPMAETLGVSGCQLTSPDCAATVVRSLNKLGTYGAAALLMTSHETLRCYRRVGRRAAR